MGFLTSGLVNLTHFMYLTYTLVSLAAERD